MIVIEHATAPTHMLLWPAVPADLRNGTLRKKYDGLKYTLKKLEVRLGLGFRVRV